MNFFKKYQKNRSKTNQSDKNQNPQIYKTLKDNIEEIKIIFIDTPGLIVREFTIVQTNSRAALVYLTEIVDKKAINKHILTPLLFKKENGQDDFNPDPVVSLGNMKQETSWSNIEQAILHGRSILFIEKKDEAFVFDTQSFPERAIADSQIEPSLKGSHQGFTESSGQNLAMIRRFVANRELKVKDYEIGKRSKTKVSVIYLRDVANPEKINELDNRLNSLEVDTILNAGMLAEYIEDNAYSPFPQLLMTERPDFASYHLLQGRIVVIVDKSPSVLVAPVTFSNFFESIDDYGSRWLTATFIRLMRYFALFAAIFLPAIYIAVITFHPEIVPIKMLITLGISRERVPFPPLFEALIMEITIEMLREAGLRLPAPIGQTVGIVGGIVIGQAAVQAGIVSNVMVIAVALTAIASFIMANYDMGAAIRILRFPMMLLASFSGFMGLVIGFMILLGHFISLESLGTPYGSPFAPTRLNDLKNSFIRFPVWSLINRPKAAGPTQLKKDKSSRPEGG